MTGFVGSLLVQLCWVERKGQVCSGGEGSCEREGNRKRWAEDGWDGVGDKWIKREREGR